MKRINDLLEVRDNSISPYELRKVNLLNRISALSIYLALMLNTSNLLLQRYPQFIMISIFVVFVFIPTILIQKRGYYSFARNFFCLTQLPFMIGACLYNISLGEFINSENIFLILAPIFVILYDKDLKIILYGLTLVSFFSIRVYEYHVLNKALDDMFFISSTVYLVVFLAMYYFINSYMNAFVRVCQYQKLLIDQMGIQKKRLEKTNSTKNKLFSIVSHDLRRPIHMLTGLLQLEDKLPEKALKQHRKQVEENVVHINTMIETILTWAKSQLEGFETQIEKISINNLLAKELNLFEEQARQKNIEIIANLSEEISIQSDLNQLSLIIRNIVNNSLKFTPHDGRITIEVFDHKYHIHVVIKDSGIGMKKETINDVLSGKFTRSTSGTSGEHGSGLGLALCIETLEKIGGTLSISSEVGKGSQFNIQLPKSISST